MKTQLTRKKALSICLELWTWMLDHPEKEKKDWPEWEKYGRMMNHCPCCEYIEKSLMCDSCPIVWPDLNCESDRSPYRKWCIAKSDNNRRSTKRYIRQIIILTKKAIELC